MIMLVKLASRSKLSCVKTHLLQGSYTITNRFCSNDDVLGTIDEPEFKLKRYFRMVRELRAVTYNK